MSGATNKKFSKLGVLVSLLGIFCIAYKVNGPVLRASLAQASWVYLAESLLFSIFAYLLAGLRWKLLQDRPVSYAVAMKALTFSYVANLLLPARAGDLFKLTLMKRYAGIPYSVSLGRLFVEKFLDLACVFGLCIVSASLFFKRLPWVPWALSLVMIGFLICVLVLKFQKNSLVSFLKFISKKFSRMSAICQGGELVLEHLDSLLKLRELWKPCLVTLSMWFGVHLISVNFIFLALGEHVSVLNIAFLVGVSALGVSLPSAPAAIGVFHAVITSAAMLLGFNFDKSLAIAIFLHLIFQLPSVLLSIYVMLFQRENLHIDSTATALKSENS